MRKNTALSIIFGVLFLVLLTALRVIDVQSIGPEGSSVGFAHLNQWFHELTGVHMTLYTITDKLGYLAILVCVAFGGIGLSQLQKGQSFEKVDATIYTLGGLYIVTIIIYALFEIVVINYRPIIMPEEMELAASFPSSHTVLSCVVMVSTAMIIHQYINNDKICKVLQCLCALVLMVSVIGRLLCGAHWLTDIVAGLLIATSLLFAFASVIEKNLRK